jgi:sigma-E factor negative regulatory protein RseC
MYEEVKVTKILSPDMLEVSCSSAACNGCKGGAFCNTKNKRFEAFNEEKLSVKQGSTVKIYLKPSRTIAGTLITLILPLLLFPVAYYLSKLAHLGEGASFLIAIGGIAVGFIGVYLYFKKKEKHYLPVVEQVLSEESEE